MAHTFTAVMISMIRPPCAGRGVPDTVNLVFFDKILPCTGRDAPKAFVFDMPAARCALRKQGWPRGEGYRACRLIRPCRGRGRPETGKPGQRQESCRIRNAPRLSIMFGLFRMPALHMQGRLHGEVFAGSSCEIPGASRDDPRDTDNGVTCRIPPCTSRDAPIPDLAGADFMVPALPLQG
jgi:hypothetical protein